MKSKKKHNRPKQIMLGYEQKKAMHKEINRQILETEKKFARDMDAAILWTLHVHFGFGKIRLRRFWDGFLAEHKKLREYYQIEPDKNGWICRQKLKEIGVDVDAWCNENKKES